MDLLRAAELYAEPAIRDFDLAEQALAANMTAANKVELRAAAFRKGRQAAWETHHLADRYFIDINGREPERREIQALILALEDSFSVEAAANREFSLLQDVVDAFKHVRLKSDNRLVKTEADVVVLTVSYGQGGYGSGRYGGGDRISVQARDGSAHHLFGVCRRVKDAWVAAASAGWRPS